jgi:hypothetical protein
VRPTASAHLNITLGIRNRFALELSAKHFPPLRFNEVQDGNGDELAAVSFGRNAVENSERLIRQNDVYSLAHRDFTLDKPP